MSMRVEQLINCPLEKKLIKRLIKVSHTQFVLKVELHQVYIGFEYFK